MSTEHDLEYGPTPPGAAYEHTDIDPAMESELSKYVTRRKSV